MPTWLALFRGINVGGRNKMPMAELRSSLETAGCSSVRTYIQSGNVVFKSRTKSKAKLTQKLSDATELQFGFRPQVLLLTDTAFRAACKNNPFPEAEREPKTLHFFFLEEAPVSPDTSAINAIAAASEHYRLIDDVFYLHAPDGFGRSKLATRVERLLGTPATARNYTTIRNLSEMLEEC